MNKDYIRNKVQQVIQKKHFDFVEISNYIFNHPELGTEEFKSSKYLAEVLKKEGFKVEFPYTEIPTAFVAEYGTGEYTFAYLAEYDALPGYGEKGEPAHACGHNWIAATMCGAGIVLSKIADEIGCRVKVIGCPAEETIGAKYDLCNKGAFDDVDFAFQAHLEKENNIEPITLAMNSVEFRFKGKAAHSAQCPEEGINALDGVLLLFSGVNAIRQHVRSDVRIHGIINNGGEAPNITPAYASCKFAFRARDKEYLQQVRGKIINIAKGAALMTGAQLEYEDFENPYDDMVNIAALVKVTKKEFEEVGVKHLLLKDEAYSPGSSDVGNVSHVCPTLYVELNPEADEPLLVHQSSALNIVNSQVAHKKMRQTIEAFVMVAEEITKDKKCAEKIKKQFQERK